MEKPSKDPLHGKRLDTILEELLDYYDGFEELGKQINIRCFNEKPSINSSFEISTENRLGESKSGKFVSVCFETEEEK